MRKLAYFLLTFLLCAHTSAETRGFRIITDAGNDIGGYKGSYALVIGVSEYTNGWPVLESINTEVSEVQYALEQNGFDDVRVVMNPDSEALQAAFETFIDDYGFDADNRLLFFFAGHGYTRKNGEKGYLVPADAPNPNVDLSGFLRKALTMTEIISLSKIIEAKHALFLFDSCFSGTVFKTRALPSTPPIIEAYTSKPVRQFITAGSAGQEVPAKSVFTPSFIRALRGDGDLNNDGFISGSELGLHLSQEVPKYRTGQTPQFGKILDPSLNEGDFVFSVRGAVSVPSKTTTNANFSGDEYEQMLATYQVIKESNDIDELTGFLNAFPLSPFKNTIEKRRSELENQAQQSTNDSNSDGYGSHKTPLSEDDAYEHAINLILRTKDYPKASIAFKAFLNTYPHSPYASNAHYWLGQLLFNERAFDGATAEFELVLLDSSSKKRADALIKLGVISEKQGKPNKADGYYRQVQNEYPDSRQSKLAQQRQKNL